MSSSTKIVDFASLHCLYERRPETVCPGRPSRAVQHACQSRHHVRKSSCGKWIVPNRLRPVPAPSAILAGLRAAASSRSAAKAWGWRTFEGSPYGSTDGPKRAKNSFHTDSLTAPLGMSPHTARFRPQVFHRRPQLSLIDAWLAGEDVCQSWSGKTWVSPLPQLARSAIQTKARRLPRIRNPRRPRVLSS